MLVPSDYYEPTILKDQVLSPCLAGQSQPLCRQYTYPDTRNLFPTAWSDYAERPDGGTDVYSWEDDPNVLSELGSRRLASLARWQPELDYRVDLAEPGKHVLAVAFFTPGGEDAINGTKYIGVTTPDRGDQRKYGRGRLIQRRVHPCD